METIHQVKFRGPLQGVLAVIFTILFIGGLSYVTPFTATHAHFPSPWQSAATIAAYFSNQPHDVLMCAFFQFCSAIPLGLFAVTAVSRMRFLGVKAAGSYISLFGGVMVAINVALSASIMWVMAYPGIAQDTAVIRALYYVAFTIGGVGYSVPLGLLIAGIAVSGGLTKLLPKWLMWFGLLLACCGELSCLSLIFPKLVYLIPLTRFPGFIWLIITGFKLVGAKTKPV